MTRNKTLPIEGASSRRSFGKFFGAFSLLAGCTAEEREELEQHHYLLPPPNATVQTTACAYCVVGCGYKAYTWPVGTPPGGPLAHENALNVNFPTEMLSGAWIAPEMYNVILANGTPHHLVIVPDHTTEVVNVGGDYNLGGSLAQRFYRSNGPTHDRLLYPQLRVGGELRRITWEEAIAILVGVSQHVLDNHGKLAWGMKSYSYQFYENTYALTKLCFEAIGTPCWAPHDAPADGSSTPGLSDAGISGFSAAYLDFKEADVLFVSGVGLSEQRAILFSQWVVGGPKLIVVNPRRDDTADYALENEGMFLQINPGTDTLLHNALAWVILKEGWKDTAFIIGETASTDEIGIEAASSFRRARFGMTFADYEAFILGDERHRPENAAAITGISDADIREAARRMAAPLEDGKRPNTSFMLEKGNYWTHNYANTASLASLGLLVGAGNRPGRMISRGGGHQRGMIMAAKYPLDLSPDSVDGNKIHLNLDLWFLRGKLRFAWVIGCTWLGGGSAHASALYEVAQSMARDIALPQLDPDLAFRDEPDKPLDVAYVIATLNMRTDQNGLVLVQQDIYPQTQTDLVDLVLPAASWGEAPFTRMQGERRLRHYAHIVDSPGEAKPDFRIIAEFAKGMGFDGFDWADENAVFEAAAKHSKGTEHDYEELVTFAKEKGKTAHDYLASLGTTGLQCPIKRDGANLVGTVRLHEQGFSTKTKKAVFLRASWDELVKPRQDRLGPRPGELWVLNRRTGSTWSSMVEDKRIPFRLEQLPENILEMHPDDAAKSDVNHGDFAWIATDDLLSESIQNGVRKDGAFYARVVVTNRVMPGVSCSYFNHGAVVNHAANSVVPNVADPVTNLFSFKMGRGRVTRLP